MKIVPILIKGNACK